VVLLGLVPLLSAGLAGCNQEPEAPTLTVLAAASLTEPFTELARTFEAEHGVEVVTSFDSSATLASQVAAGAPADVVATADRRTMQLVADGGALSGRPRTFARNRLALVVPPDNPAGIASLTDLQRAEFVVCAAAAPCGALAADLLGDAGVTARPRSLEVDVKAVLTKVTLGEADAGLVYASDVVAAGEAVREIPLGRPSPGTAYLAAVTADTHEPELAQAFLALVTSPRGQQVLDEAGLTPVGPSGAQ
jgi:molybdate transport system substrate-binding protein